jgi:phosphatidate cytidylyltransferase
VTDDKREGDELFEDLDKFFAPIKDVDWDEPEEAGPRPPNEEHVAVRADEGPEGASSSTPEDDDDDDDEAWYDTTMLEPVSGLMDDDEGGSEPETVRIMDADEDSALPEDTDQGDLFSPETSPTSAASGPSDEDLEAAAEHFAGSLRNEQYDTAPIGGYDLDEGGEDEVRGDLLAELGAEEVEHDILSDLHDPAEASRTVVVGAEGISGPSWQEPAAVEVGADLERRGPNTGERDVPAAFMTGLILAGVALASLLAGPGWFTLVATVAVVAAQGELFGMVAKHGYQPATFVGLVGGVLVMAGAYYRSEAAIPAMFALGVIASFLWFMTVPAQHRQRILQNVGVSVLSLAWIPLLAAYLVATLKLPDGTALVVATVGLTFVFDTAAFLVGSVWGGSFFQRPLASNISPKKSMEGLIGATLITVVMSVALVPSFIEVFQEHRLDALLLAIVVSVAATLGDLAESLVKRDLGIKDMGSVLPGHGGVLDRIDSLLFVAPAAFFLFRVVLLG